MSGNDSAVLDYFLQEATSSHQSAGVTAWALRIARLPAAIRPKVIIGGYAAKLGSMSETPGAELMADINSL